MNKRSRQYGLYLVTTFILLYNGAIAQTTWTDSTLSNGNTVRMKIDPRTGVPHRLTGLDVDFKRYGDLSEANIQAMSRAFLAEYADLFRIEIESLSLEKAESRKGRWYVNFVQKVKGVPVYRSSVGFTISTNGKVPVVGVDYYSDIDIDVTPGISAEMALEVARGDFIQLSDADTVDIRLNPELIILPREEHESYTYSLAYRLELAYKGPQSVFDECYFIHAASGDIIQRYSNIRDATVYGTVSINHWPEHHYDTQSTGKARHEKVRLYNDIGQYLDTYYTSTTGYYNFPNLPVSYYYVRSKLEGSYVRLYQNSEDHNAFVYVGAHNWTWNASDATNVYYHANKIHDFFKGSPFSYNGMDYQMKAYVNEGSGANGWADGTNIGFGSEGSEEWARSSDIVYHEYTHNTIYHLYNGWIGVDYYEQGYAMDEGLADYFACSQNYNDIFGESVGLSRDLSNTRVWTSNNGAYWNGMVIGGACWDLRGYIGVSLTDELVFDALYMADAYDFEDFALNVLVADDNDGNLNNGTPHYDEIEEAFEINHGIPVYDPLPPPPAAPVLSWYIYEGSSINLSWTGGTEEHFDHFYLYRSLGSNITTTNHGYQDRSVIVREWGAYTATYKVKAVDIYDQSSAWSNVKSTNVDFAKRIAEQAGGLPETYGLNSNTPNPFNPATTLRYDLPEASRVRLVIYDIIGREVMNWEGVDEAGYRQVLWHGTDQQGRTIPAGIYIYRLVAASVESDKRFTASRKMVLLK